MQHALGIPTIHAGDGLNSAEHSQKYQLYQKTLQIKVVENKIPRRKLSGRACLSPLGVELGSLKNCCVLNIIMQVLKWESSLTLGLNVVKITSYTKKCFK